MRAERTRRAGASLRRTSALPAKSLANARGRSTGNALMCRYRAAFWPRHRVRARRRCAEGGTMKDRIFMSSPDVGQLEEDAVVAAMRSGWIAPLGPDVDAFERELAARVGVRHAVALSSGTAALHLGLLTLGVGPGDVVITSTMTFAATANAIVYTGAEPFFIDALPRTGNMSPALLREALTLLREAGQSIGLAYTPGGSAGEGGRLHGHPGDRWGIRGSRTRRRGRIAGGHPHGPRCGSFGQASIVSFNGNKIMTTSGGGMLLAAAMRHSRTTCAIWQRKQDSQSCTTSTPTSATTTG